MSKPKSVILHIGLHKTGTTFLQKMVFRELSGEEVYYVRYKDNPILGLLDDITNLNPCVADMERYEQLIPEYLASIAAPIVFISRENIIGSPRFNYHNCRFNADVMKRFFPEAKIIITIRRQDDWYESLYNQMVKAGARYSVEHFLNYHNGQFLNYRQAYAAFGRINVRLSFTELVRYYQSQFSDVLVLPYEMMKTDPEEFLKKIYSFSGIQKPYFPATYDVYKNRGYSKLSANIARFTNRFVNSIDLPDRSQKIRDFLEDHLDRLIYVPNQFISNSLRREIMALQADNNRELAEMTGCDLGRYGYY